MKSARYLHFSAFCLDRVEDQLWQGTQLCALRRKAFAMLRCLTEHAREVVTKDALLTALWPGVHVSEEVLTVHMREVRKVLGDDARTPQFIETVHGRGYRFIKPVVSSQWSVVSNQKTGENRLQRATGNGQLTTPLVGRETELARLHTWLDKALRGERQLVFVTGEPGIGKTTLVEAFLCGVRSHEAFGVQTAKPRTLNTELPSTPSLWIGRGQCIEHYGAGEAYLPVLEALGRLGREPGGKQLITMLRRGAPSWLVQLPALVSVAEREKLQQEAQGATRERMLREMAEALEALTAVHPLVLVLEDLHWSDGSTLDLLAVLARRPEQARLLVIGTYRPVDMLANGHPLRAVVQELHLHRQCEELRLGFLTEENVAEYLTMRFRLDPSSITGEGQEGGVSCQQASQQPPHPDPLPQGEREPIATASFHKLARAIYQRTEGNPLFLVSVVEDLVAQGVLIRRNGTWQLPDEGEAIERNVPESIRHLVTRQSERLSSTEQQVLAAASVAGLEFSAAAVAAALTRDVVAVEEQCTALAERQQFVRRAGIAAWPDGTVAARYGFVHALYQQLWHERVSVTQLRRWHLGIGERKEAAYGERAREIAAELAVHFEQGRDYRKAMQYLQHAGQNVIRWSAHQEAITHLTKGLELLKLLPDTPERARQELGLQYDLNKALICTKGVGVPELERLYTRVEELCHQVGEIPYLFWIRTLVQRGTC